VVATDPHYDRAIAVLDAAKVEYELGVALQRRAQLHEVMGRLDQARADAATAQRRFAAVGAAVEREETRNHRAGA
jgi:hypothetical protein